MTTGEINPEFVNRIREEVGDAETEEILAVVAGIKPAPLTSEIHEEPPESAVPPETSLIKEAGESGDIRQKLSKLSKPEKLKAAMFGNSVVRRLLVTDPNRLIQEAVLGNPRLTAPEVEEFSKNTSVDSQVFRTIAANHGWMRTYKIKLNLVRNPKCPQDVSLKWLKFLHSNDIKNLARSKSVPQTLQVAARKLMQKDE